ncbi:unnamed protein product [Lactuca saligna]|uniref:Uncharacterized protein n=1 Tax=Lactuca saligna TaxID=75948 RepID=A0AA35ZFG2_LACSI|nr:unnamed protein product [Lactuca saligna]
MSSPGVWRGRIREGSKRRGKRRTRVAALLPILRSLQTTKKSEGKRKLAATNQGGFVSRLLAKAVFRGWMGRREGKAAKRLGFRQWSSTEKMNGVMGEKGKRFKVFQIDCLVWLFLVALLLVRSEVNTKEMGNRLIEGE